MRRPIFMMWLAVVALFATGSAFADRLVVARGSYQLVWDATSSPEKARMVSDAAASALKNRSTWEIVQLDDECGNAACLSALAEKNQAKQAVAIDVSEDTALYEIRLVLANGEEKPLTSSGPFADMLKDVAKLSVETLVEEPADSANENPAESERDGSESRAGTTEERDTRHRLSPAPFWVSLGLTGALAVSAVALDIAAYRQHKELEDFDGTRDEWFDARDRGKRLQLADRVLLGCTAAGVVATGVLFFFTDFHKKKDKKDAGVEAVAPVVSADFTGVALVGRF